MDTARFQPQLDAYLDGIDLDSVTNSVAEAMGSDLAAARNHVATHVGEVRVAMRLVGPAIHRDMRVLEVGSGVGLFAGYLRSINIDVTELEPVGLGFEFIGEARDALSSYTRPSAHLDIGVEQLDPALHGRFDLIFSLNVLEHVADWRLALEACASVLGENGQMIHAHPNYTIPYEPHFGVPLLPFRPGLTSFVLPDRMTNSDTWKSLNWITARQVRRWCRSTGLQVEFRSGVLAQTVDRVVTDQLFQQRHRGIARAGVVLVRRLRLVPLLERLPATLNSPTEYVIRHQKPSAAPQTLRGVWRRARGSLVRVMPSRTILPLSGHVRRLHERGVHLDAAGMHAAVVT